MTRRPDGSLFVLRKLVALSLVLFIPLASMAEVTPKVECPKKGKEKMDSTNMVEEELLPANEYDLKHNVMQEDFMDYPMARPTSTVSTPSTPSVASNEIDEESVESPLSFNLVYYIFEKFKFSSSVEP